MASPHVSTMKSGKRGRKYVQTFFQVAGGQEQEESKTEQEFTPKKLCNGYVLNSLSLRFPDS